MKTFSDDAEWRAFWRRVDLDCERSEAKARKLLFHTLLEPSLPDPSARTSVYATWEIPVRPVERIPTIRFVSSADADFVRTPCAIPEEPSRDTETAS